jgi:RimJ/RimL family protein N-acetyltransferase
MSAVTLVPLDRRHATAMARWAADPEVRDNLGLRADASLEATERWIERALGDDAFCAFAIDADGTHVGNVVLDQIDRHRGMARFHIYLGEASVRGHGVGGKATSLAVRHAFDVLGLFKVWLTVHADNKAAIAAYERAGFRHEGRLRAEFLFRGKRLDALYMGILRTDEVP